MLCNPVGNVYLADSTFDAFVGFAAATSLAFALSIGVGLPETSASNVSRITFPDFTSLASFACALAARFSQLIWRQSRNDTHANHCRLSPLVRGRRIDGLRVGNSNL